MGTTCHHFCTRLAQGCSVFVFQGDEENANAVPSVSPTTTIPTLSSPSKKKASKQLSVSTPLVMQMIFTSKSTV